MLQQMINSSIAVLTRPSVSTFEEHERNDLGWAMIYSVIAGVINAVIVGISNVLSAVLSGEEASIGPSVSVGAIVGTIIFTMIRTVHQLGFYLPAGSDVRRNGRVWRIGL